MVKCKCGAIFKNDLEFFLHLNIIRPAIPCKVSVTRGYITESQYNKAIEDLRRFENNHHKVKENPS